MATLVRGAVVQGRKKGGGSAPTEAPDSLRSIQHVQLVDLISEGPIKGLVNGLKSVYLDGVPVENADGSKNFANVDFGLLLGTQGQSALPGFDTVQNERAVGTEVRLSTPVVQTILNTSVDHVRVTISVPQLTHLDTGSGNLSGSSFGFAIDIQSAGGGFATVWTQTISAKTTSNYKRAVRLALPGAGPWDIRVRRTTAEPTTSDTVNRFFWDSFTEIQSVSLRYPNSAVAGIRASSEQFSNVPSRAYDVMGLVVRVPTNYDPIAGTYTGIWDGTFKIAWTNNPAWVFFDIATHPRYGLGQYLSDNHLDKWKLYQIGRYCDERVSDGQGGTEPRFTCNLYLQTAAQARQVLSDLASLFRAISYWSAGGVAVVQDAPSDAVMLFTKANVVGEFAYQGVSRKTRHSSWTVYYNDLAQLGKRAPAVHVSRELVAQLGVVNEYLSPIGCTSRGQATRLARWAELSEALGRTVSFTAGPEAAGLLPGDVFKVADPHQAGKRLGGRIRASTTTAVTLDAPVTIEAGETYHLEVALVDAAEQLGFRTERRPVTNAPGETSVLTVSPAFTQAPQNSAIWVLQPDTIQPTWWRLVGRKEKGNNFDLVGLAHDPDKYAAVESGLKLSPKPTSGLSAIAPPITAINVTESPYLDNKAVRTRVTVSWVPPARGLTFQVAWRLDQGPWTTMPRTSANAVDIDDLIPGELDLRIETINSLGRPSAPFTETVAMEGWIARPEDVAAFVAEPVIGGLALSWTPCVAGNYTSTKVYAGAEDTEEEDAELVYDGRGNAHTWHPPGGGTYKLWARHYNSADKKSLHAAEHELEYVPIGVGLSLKASAPMFVYDAAGVATPDEIVFSAIDYLDADDLVWEVVDGTATLTGTGATRTLALADLTTQSARIKVTEGDQFDEVTVFSISETGEIVFGYLSNEVHNVATAADGTGGTYTGAGGRFIVQRGTTELNDDCTFSVASSTGIVSMAIDADGVYSLAGMSADTGVATLRATYGDLVIERVYKIAKVKQGTAGSAGGFVDYIFKRSATPPSTPTGNGLPSGWSDVPPAGPDPLYFSVAPKLADDTLPVGAVWATPTRIDGTSVQVQYSVNGSTSWHSTFTTGDLYMRQSVDGGSTWTGAIRIVGEQGLAGDPGGFVDYVFRRSSSPPATPTGNGTPSGWSDAPPAGSDPLYASTAPKLFNDSLAPGGSWSTPVRIDGPAGAAGQSVTVQYSVNGSTSWHSTFTTGDLYMRQSIDGGSSWSGAIRIVGEKGADGLALILSTYGVSVPADSNGNVLSYALAGTVGSVLLAGVADSGWSFSRTNGSGTSSNISGATVSVFGITGDSGYVQVYATKGGVTLGPATFTVTRVKNGADGSPGGGGGSGPVTGGVFEADGTTSAAVRFLTDGTAQKGVNGAFSAAGVWYNPPTSGVGAAYFVKVTVTGGALTSGPVGTWVQLNSNQTWQLVGSAGIDKSVGASYQISSSAGGSILGSGIIGLTCNNA